MEKVVLLVGNTDTSRIMFNALKDDFNIVKVIEEKAESTKKFIQRRIQRLGLTTVAGQIAFILINKQLKKQSWQRIQSIYKNYNLNCADYPINLVEQVESVNSQQVINQLNQLEPDVIVVNGTRIISKKVLKSVPAPFINTHTGITPKYRGVHGGYWALTQRDFNNCGVTVHLVDEGIDTGGILHQDTIKISPEDNFNTYPYLQYAAAVPLMKTSIQDVLNQNIKIKTNDLPSQLWYHPTISEYIKYQQLYGVK